MAITGLWKEQRQIQAGAGIWGSGWNPIHAVPDSYGGRNIAPDPNVITNTRDYEIIDLNAPYTTYEADYDSESIWGYGTETGTADRPSTMHHLKGDGNTQVTTQLRAKADYPSLNENGDSIRSRDHGAEASTYISKKNPRDEALNGWTNKEDTHVTNAQPSDQTQYEMTTSMTQRDKVRGMSQTTGRASTFEAPIASRIIGEKLKRFVGSPERLFDMFPRQQAYMVRPFWQRSAGTDAPEKMRVNDTYVSVPLTRVSPADPYQGAELQGNNDGYYDTQWTTGYN